jgi:anti-sigma factor RsiW
MQAAAAVVLFALGIAIGTLWRGSTSTEAMAGGGRSWTQRAAVAHAVYAPEVRHPVEVSVREGDAAQQREQEAHLSRWLTRRLTVPVKLFDLRDQGFELVGGRLLPDAAGPSAQLMYQDTMGMRVTVYLRKAGEHDARLPSATNAEATSACSTGSKAQRLRAGGHAIARALVVAGTGDRQAGPAAASAPAR